MALANFFALSVHMLWLLLFKACNAVESKTSRVFPAILVFGDSTVDTGNNNYIPTLFKADYSAHGRDFPGQIATGRFSNGKLIPDILASSLGIKELFPAFLDPKLSDGDLRTGISFGSAGSGYDDLTTTRSVAIPAVKQIDLFKNYVQRLERIVGEEGAKKILNGALVIVSAGSNDFILNFYEIPSRSLEFNISGYQALVLNRLQSFIMVSNKQQKGAAGPAWRKRDPCVIQRHQHVKSPKKYLFWDSVHPTESAYNFVAESILKQLGPYPIQN